MPTLVKHIRQLHTVEFDQGKFDEWCVYLKRQGQRRYAPRDEEYFDRLQQLGERYGHRAIYDDFVRIYEPTDTSINPEILQLIHALSNAYAADAEEVEIWFTVLYAGMIAEENKTNMVLRKRIKRLGMHQVLIEKMNPLDAAKFSLGKKYAELDPMMKERGF